MVLVGEKTAGKLLDLRITLRDFTLCLRKFQL